MMFPYRKIGAALAALAVALPAAADPLEEVFITANRVPQPLAEAVGNRAVLDTEALKLVAHAHIQQSFNRLPGVGLHRNSGQEYLPAVRSPVLTGAGACGSFLMAEDGIPLRPAGFCNVNELFEAHTESARRIEVIRGPASVLYGSNALHGAVNVIAPAAFDRDSTLSLETGPDDYGRLQAQWGDDTWAAAFTGTHGRHFRKDAGADQQKLSLRHRYRAENFTATTGLTAINLNQETAGYIVGFKAYEDEDLVESNPNPEAFRDARAVRLWSRFEDNAERPAWVVTPYARHSDMDFRMHFLPGTPLEQNGQTSVGVQSGYYFYGEASQIIAGLDLEYAQGWLKQSQDGQTQGSAFLRETIPAGDHYDYEVDAMQIAPYVQWQWQPAERWQLTAGLRYEYMRYDYDNLMIAGRTRDDGTVCPKEGCRYTRPADRTDSFDNVSDKIGALYDLTDDQQVFVSLARGFRAPQSTELYRLRGGQNVADLDSVQLDSLEVGVRGGDRALRYELVAYVMDKDHVIFQDTDDFYFSDGQTRHRGVELAFNYRFNPRWDIGLSATAARHEYDHTQVINGINIDGNDVDSAPHHFGSARLGWNPLAAARLELEWQRMGAYYTDAENRHRYEGHDLFHLRGQWQVSPAVSLSARVLNLLDEEYAERADFSDFVGDRYFPGRPRSLYVGVSYSW